MTNDNLHVNHEYRTVVEYFTPSTFSKANMALLLLPKRSQKKEKPHMGESTDLQVDCHITLQNKS